jgi:hypothetical protein
LKARTKDDCRSDHSQAFFRFAEPIHARSMYLHLIERCIGQAAGR